MVYAALAPQAALQRTFGATLEGLLAEIIVRNWRALMVVLFIGCLVSLRREQSRT